VGGRARGVVNTSPSCLPYGRQTIEDDDVAAVAEVLRSDFLTTGPTVEAFESALAQYCGAKHAVAVANGTAALHVAMLALELRSGAWVLTSANTFLASANCAEYVGARADFADIDARTYSVTAGTIAAAWKEDIRAVVPVDFAGQPCDLPAIAQFARSKGAAVVVDSCHAIGAAFGADGKRYMVGANPWADMTCFSFHPVKTITTAEGGAILTDNDDLANRCRRFRNHGMTKSPNEFTEPSAAALGELGPWYYEMPAVGYNYRLNDLQCALGINQVRKLTRFVRRRCEIVARYNAAFAELPDVTLPYQRPGTAPAWHLYVVQVDFESLGKTRTKVMKELRDAGVGAQVHYIPVHLQPYYQRKYGYSVGKCPVAERYYQRCLSLPLYAGLNDFEVSRVIEVVGAIVSA
jgi:perosamine synthetase